MVILNASAPARLIASRTPLAPSAVGWCRVVVGQVLLAGQAPAEAVVGRRCRDQTANQRPQQSRPPVQAQGRQRQAGVGLSHGEHQRQSGRQMPVRRAPLLHHRQGGNRGCEADETDLQRREQPQAGQAEGSHPGRRAEYHPIQQTLGLQQAHQGQHDHHHRQQDEEGEFHGRATGREKDVDNDHGRATLKMRRGEPAAS